MWELSQNGLHGRYVDDVPAATLAMSNTPSLFGLHRRRLGAICGHLAAFEMTSSVPNQQFAAALRRLGRDEPAATRFFDEHVEADSVHDQVALHDLCGTLAREQPALAADVVHGAACSPAMDALLGGHLLDAWQRGVSSQRPRPAPRAA